MPRDREWKMPVVILAGFYCDHCATITFTFTFQLVVH